MAWTQADIDKLDAAIATGAKVVQFSDQRIEYQDVDDMLKARSLMAREVNAADIQTTRYAATSKGL